MTTVFLCGSSKLSSNKGDYWYLDPSYLDVLDPFITFVDNFGLVPDIIIGDAPGFDTMMQDHMFQKNIKNVIVCHGEPDGPRHKADPEWEEVACASRSEKDIYMREVSDICVGVTIPGGSHITKENLEAFMDKFAYNLELTTDGRLSFKIAWVRGISICRKEN